MKRALLVVDAQKVYTTAATRLARANAPATPRALITAFRSAFSSLETAVFRPCGIQSRKLTGYWRMVMVERTPYRKLCIFGVSVNVAPRISGDLHRACVQITTSPMADWDGKHSVFVPQMRRRNRRNWAPIRTLF
jgi:hypothetical protein